MHIRSTIVLLLLAVLCSSPTAWAETVTENLSFVDTRVGAERTQSTFVSGIRGTGTHYRVDIAPDAPFRWAGDSADVEMRFGRITVTVAFRPYEVGPFTGYIQLIRDSPEGSPDTIFVRLTGEGYSIQTEYTLDFGRVFRGDSVRRSVYLDKILNDGGVRWEYAGRLDDPFSVITRFGPVNVPREDTVAWVFQFKPMRLGVFTDTIGLVRVIGFIRLDTITVYMQGAAAGYSVDHRVDYDTLMTGDSLAKERIVAVPPDPRFEIADPPGEPKDPFKLIYFYYPDPRPPDSARIGISYVPKNVGAATDSLFFVRFDDRAQEMDSIRLRFEGTAVGMKAADTVTFDPVRRGDDLSQDLLLQLPARMIYRNFRYAIEPESQGVASAQITSPTGPSNTRDIALRFRVKVNGDFVSTTYRFVLYRLPDNGVKEFRPIDSTVIHVVIKMVPRPVNFGLIWIDDNKYCEVGDTVQLHVALITNDPFDQPVKVVDFNAMVFYEPSVFVPLPAPGQERVVFNDQAALRLSFTDSEWLIDTSPFPVATITGVAALGVSDHTNIALKDAVVTYPPKGTHRFPDDTCRLSITDIWHYSNGQPRYVNSLQGDLVLEVEPNPIATSATLRVDKVPSQQGRLLIVDALGRTMADLTGDLRDGIREWTIAKGSGSPLSLSTGTYYARLVVDGVNNETIYTVARLFVVQ